MYHVMTRLMIHAVTGVGVSGLICRYRDEADKMADQLLENVLNREEVIRENYFSGTEPGGGEPDFQWSGAVYLLLANRRYRIEKME